MHRRGPARVLLRQLRRRCSSSPAAAGPNVTVYVHGMGDEGAGHMAQMLDLHQSAMAGRWGDSAVPFRWDGGKWDARATATAAAFHAARFARPNAALFAASVTADAARLAYTYSCAKAVVPDASKQLSQMLGRYSRRGVRTRVVAFSLGGNVALHAAAALPAHHRPSELHLICPPLYENDAEVATAFRRGPAGRTVLYYTEKDVVLYAAMVPDGSTEPPIGARGLQDSEYPESVSWKSISDVVTYPAAHAQAARSFHKFVV